MNSQHIQARHMEDVKVIRMMNARPTGRGSAIAIQALQEVWPKKERPREEPDLATAMVLELSNGIRHSKAMDGKP